jgi:hypothetical protein
MNILFLMLLVFTPIALIAAALRSLLAMQHKLLPLIQMLDWEDY